MDDKPTKSRAQQKEELRQERIARVEAEAAPEQPETNTVLIRIEEWVAWLPQRDDGRIAVTSGVTGFEAFSNEKVLEVSVSATKNRRYVPVVNPDDPDAQPQNVPHAMYAFQAVLASNFDGPVPESPNPDGPLNDPTAGPNREQRRKNGRKK